MSRSMHAVDQPRGRLRLMLIGLGVLVVVGGACAGAIAWGPLQRAHQLADLDRCRTEGLNDEGLQLAIAFSDQWGASSTYVIEAISGGHGPLAARIHLCRAAGQVRLLASLLKDDRLSSTEQGQVCTAVCELLDEADLSEDLTLNELLKKWAFEPEGEPQRAAPALSLLIAIAGPTAITDLSAGTLDSRFSAERSMSMALGLCTVIERRGGGVSPLLSTIHSPGNSPGNSTGKSSQRSALLAAPLVVETVKNNAVPADAPRLTALLAQPDSLALGLAGLGGKRFHLSDNDHQARASLTTQMLPYLTVTTPDAVLSGALGVVARQHLIGAHTQVIALIPRLAKNCPPQLSAADLDELLGTSLISTKTPEATVAAETMVSALTTALGNATTRRLAISALSRVQFQNVVALRIAIDQLALGNPPEPACTAALNHVVGKVYGREDLVKASLSRSWSTVLSEDRRKRARYDAMTTWLSEHAEETTARTAQDVMVKNKAELSRMRDEIQGWLDAKQPPPIGVTQSDLNRLSEDLRLMLSSVIKATH